MSRQIPRAGDDFLDLGHKITELAGAALRAWKRARREPVTDKDYDTVYAYQHNDVRVVRFLRAKKIDDNLWDIQEYSVVPKDDKAYDAEVMFSMTLSRIDGDQSIDPFKNEPVGWTRSLNTQDMIALLAGFDDRKMRDVHRHISRLLSGRARGEVDWTNQPH